MANLTICPKYFFGIFSTPEEFEINIVNPLISLIEEINNQKTQIVFSKYILDLFENEYPWKLKNDEVWRQYIIDWETVINNFISKAQIQEHLLDKFDGECNKLHEDIYQIFMGLLSDLKTNLICGTYYDNGVYGGSDCNKIDNCREFQLLDTHEKVRYVNHTWLNIYDTRLPIKGNYPFRPINGWEKLNGPKKTPSNGQFVDFKNLYWSWDKSHNDHWDVQLNDGSNKHIGIYPDGRWKKKDTR